MIVVLTNVNLHFIFHSMKGPIPFLFFLNSMENCVIGKKRAIRYVFLHRKTNSENESRRKISPDCIITKV